MTRVAQRGRDTALARARMVPWGESERTCCHWGFPVACVALQLSIVEGSTKALRQNSQEQRIANALISPSRVLDLAS